MKQKSHPEYMAFVINDLLFSRPNRCKEIRQKNRAV